LPQTQPLTSALDTNLLILLVIENFELFMKIELSSQWCGRVSVKRRNHVSECLRTSVLTNAELE
jgi:hypothetical protein